ncbi:MAG TPA: hypothetical protein VFG23_13725 [Polyangia bacterium]|nr:hypothetical protein [Polyangia bacterium]
MRRPTTSAREELIFAARLRHDVQVVMNLLSALSIRPWHYGRPLAMRLVVKRVRESVRDR